MTGKAWAVFVLVVATAFGTLIAINVRNKVDVSSVQEYTILDGSAMNGGVADHVYGKKDSKILLIEYGDYQCPGCGRAYPRLKNISEKYKDSIAFVFRNFPLTSIHPNAKAAAAAAEAADKQGQFWAMHSLLYENQDSWKSLSIQERTNQFVAYARQLRLNEKQFLADMDSTAIKQKIEFDIALGKKSGVEGTPTIILNGTSLTEEKWRSDDALEATIQAEMKRQGITLPTKN